MISIDITTGLFVLNVGVGLLIFGLGVLVQKYPAMIAGYNTMPREQKRKFDIEGFLRL